MKDTLIANWDRINPLKDNLRDNGYQQCSTLQQSVVISWNGCYRAKKDIVY